MPVPFQGGCLCGAVRYECTAEPVAVYYCHCTDCQKASGTAFHTGVFVPVDAFTIVQGEAATYERPSDAGNTVTHAFCRDCGAPLYVFSSARTTHRSIKAGSLDDSSWLKPEFHIWTQSETPWAIIDGVAERHAQSKKLNV